jgi:outer membrane receptor protein involved in Fe transport
MATKNRGDVNPVATETGDYTTINLAAGVRPGHWDLQMLIQNLTDCSAATYVSQDVEYPSAYRLRPRTTGVSLRYGFGRMRLR